MAYPPGGTFFDNKRSFVDVPVDESKDNAISTSEFLEAAEALTGLFDILGSVAFNPVKSDMNGNVKVRRYWAAGGGGGGGVGGGGGRGGAQALRKNLSNPSEELSNSFRDSYGRTLKQHHSFIIKPIFSAAMSATPYRKDFYAKLGDDQARVSKELDAWLKSLERIVGILNEFMVRKEAQWK